MLEHPQPGGPEAAPKRDRHRAADDFAAAPRSQFNLGDVGQRDRLVDALGQGALAAAFTEHGNDFHSEARPPNAL
jgi:hypothetical protein